MVRRYDLVVSDKEVSSYRRKRKVSEEDVDDGTIRKKMLMDHVKTLIGDARKRESVFIYSGCVSTLFIHPPPSRPVILISLFTQLGNPQTAFGHHAIQDLIVNAMFTDKRFDALAASSQDFNPVRFETIALAATAVS